MAERSPDLSPWEDVESSSDEEQLFNLDNNLTTNEYDSDDSWIAIKLHRMHPPMQASSRSLALHQPQHCSHLAERRCAINVSGQCCECSDKRSRTESGLYSTYVDGRGWVEKATRWAYYCPGCKDYHETAVLNQVMERLQRRAAQHEEAQQQFAISQCEHWLERECSITNTGKCCACSDLRPGTSSQLYPAYVDGKGWVADVSRWAHYCPGCCHYEETNQRTSRFEYNKPSAVLPTDMHLNVRLHDRDLARHQRQCTHLEPRACSMTATDGNCCACADQRPRTQSGFYATYIDGRGWVEQATRWAGYCPNCQLAFNNFATVLRRFSMEKRIRQRTRRWLQSSEQANRVHIAQTHNHNHDSNHKTIPTSSTNRGRANLITSEKACDHWQARDCSMTNNPKYCCSCLDKRPNAPSYAQYVDGIGWVMGAVRWAYYCLGCRNHHELTDRQPHEPRRQTRPRGLQRMKGALRLHGSRLRPETLQIMT